MCGKVSTPVSIDAIASTKTSMVLAPLERRGTHLFSQTILPQPNASKYLKRVIGIMSHLILSESRPGWRHAWSSLLCTFCTEGLFVFVFP